MNKQSDKLDNPESAPDYYLEKFMPVWKRYRLFLFSTIFYLLGVLFIFLYKVIPILIPDFKFIPDSEFVDVVFYGILIFIFVELFIYTYFLDKARCPKCNSLTTTYTGMYLILTGKCPSCRVKLKNRLVSDDTARIVNASIIGIYVVVSLAFLYFVFN
jgi:phage FluMu protein Com